MALVFERQMRRIGDDIDRHDLTAEPDLLFGEAGMVRGIVDVAAAGDLEIVVSATTDLDPFEAIKDLMGELGGWKLYVYFLPTR